MKALWYAIVLGCIATVLAGCGGEDSGSPSAVWKAPACAVVGGEPVATFTLDGGTTHAPFTRSVPDILIDGRSEATNRLVALPEADDTLIAIRRSREFPSYATTYDIVVSRDAGCSWVDTGKGVGPNVVQLVAGAAGTAFALEQTPTGADLIHHISATGEVEDFDLSELGNVVAAVVPHPDKAGWLRTVTPWEIWETQDLGRGGRVLSRLPVAAQGRFSQQVDSYPADWNRIALVSTVYDAARSSHDEVLVTHDGGTSWINPTGLDPLGYSNSFYQIHFGRADSNVLWLRGKERLTRLSPIVDSVVEEWLFLSRDGGRSFQRELQLAQKEWAWNLAPHPTDPEVVLWTDGFRVYGYSAATGVVTAAPALDLTDIPSRGYNTLLIEFSPADPRVIYLGVGSPVIDF